MDQQKNQAIDHPRQKNVHTNSDTRMQTRSYAAAAAAAAATEHLNRGEDHIAQHTRSKSKQQADLPRGAV